MKIFKEYAKDNIISKMKTDSSRFSASNTPIVNLLLR